MAPHDVVPEWDTLVPNVHIEYLMPSSTVSGTTVRSISVETTGNAEKFVKYTAKYRYTVDINYELGQRKDKPLKGLFDETAEADEKASSSSDSEPEVDEETTPTPSAPEEGKQGIPASTASNANDLADIFG
ncbi:unnamed protein product [Dibothriocephalus latus]|uniref:Uncharacterized protein n=1 Tax=Dibothriocephalus latus TaxID=60516 RepID=A0A3P7QKM5_DIBLA|nr:unnamed protein product [Dibothriocephalus latus]